MCTKQRYVTVSLYHSAFNFAEIRPNAQSKFGELGAGIGIGMSTNSLYLNVTPLNIIIVLLTGPNAAPILRALGLWDDILAKVNGGLDTRRTNRMGGLQTRFGDARNEVIHDVRGLACSFDTY